MRGLNYLQFIWTKKKVQFYYNFRQYSILVTTGKFQLQKLIQEEKTEIQENARFKEQLNETKNKNILERIRRWLFLIQ
jgi:hypothetical protein